MVPSTCLNVTMLADLTSRLVLVAQNNPNNSLFSGGSILMPLLLIGMLFYFMIFRPERRKRQQHARLLGNLKKNDRVVTVGGILGTVVAAQKDSEEITIKVDEKTDTKLRVLRSSISRVVTDEEKG